jgi:hypothetical protein
MSIIERFCQNSRGFVEIKPFIDVPHGGDEDDDQEGIELHIPSLPACCASLKSDVLCTGGTQSSREN